jgi:N-acetyl-D-muramate 6-phosphate phosphatase
VNPLPRCVLFDLDGTLVDSAPDLGDAANQVRAALGLEPLPIADYRPQASSGARGLLKVALGITPKHDDYENHKTTFLSHYHSNLTRYSRLFPGVPELLSALEKAKIPWGVVTNKVGWLSEPVMHNLGLFERAACLISGDSTANPKPAPDGLWLAAHKTGLPPEDCIYVGDDLRDIVAGRAAGMRTIAAGWGYLGVNTKISSWDADHIAETPTALAEMLALRGATSH